MVAFAIAAANTNAISGSIYPAIAKIAYTKSTDDSGWLMVRLEPSGERVAICEYTKTVVVKEDSRVHFLLLEGRYRKRTASLSKENAVRCLVAVPRGTGAKLVAEIKGRKWELSVPRQDVKPLHQLFATLTFDGKSAKVTLDSDVDFYETNPRSPRHQQVSHSKPLPRGTYKILAPEAPKHARNTEFYVHRAGGYPGLKYHTVWFPVEYAGNYNSSFVHVGNLSEGCVTTYELEMWNPLYLYLISNRLDPEGKYVGTITIK